MTKKSHYETLSKTNNTNADIQMKEITSNEIQLKQLIINEDVLVSKLRELNDSRERLVKSIRQKQLLADKWISLLVGQINHQGDLVGNIPVEGDVILNEADTMIEEQNQVIQGLKEQLLLRDKMIQNAKDSLKEHNANLDARDDGILSLEEIWKHVQEESSAGRSMQLPPLQPTHSNHISSNEKLFTRVLQLRMNRKPTNRSSLMQTSDKNVIIYNNKVQAEENKKNKRNNAKEVKDDKRSNSVVSQNSSFSTGASKGSVQVSKFLPLNKIPGNERPGMKAVSKSIQNRKLQKAGAQIALGGYRKLLLKDSQESSLKSIPGPPSKSEKGFSNY